MCRSIDRIARMCRLREWPWRLEQDMSINAAAGSIMSSNSVQRKCACGIRGRIVRVVQGATLIG